MSKYTTGDMAKLCGVSVRTVQYYDDRGILVPSELSEGGRRLYTDMDLKRMKIICFLRETGLPIKSIAALFEEKDPERIISVLLDEHERDVREEFAVAQRRLEMLENIKYELKDIENFSVDSIGDIANIMKNKNQLKKMRWTMVLTGIPVTLLQWISIILWITTGNWWLFVVWACVAVPWGICISKYYFDRTAYICPECHEVFKPKFFEMFWAYHTPKMRRLRCPHCSRKGLCIEIYVDKGENTNG